MLLLLVSYLIHNLPLEMGAVLSSRTYVVIYKTASCYIAEDSTLQRLCLLPASCLFFLTYYLIGEMAAVSSSEMSMDDYQTTQNYIPQDSTLHILDDSILEDLFCMFPTWNSRVTPKKPAYSLPGHL
jgi:hypothetical protein